MKTDKMLTTEELLRLAALLRETALTPPFILCDNVMVVSGGDSES